MKRHLPYTRSARASRGVGAGLEAQQAHWLGSPRQRATKSDTKLLPGDRQKRAKARDALERSSNLLRR